MAHHYLVRTDELVTKPLFGSIQVSFDLLYNAPNPLVTTVERIRDEIRKGHKRDWLTALRRSYANHANETINPQFHNMTPALFYREVERSINLPEDILKQPKTQIDRHANAYASHVISLFPRTVARKMLRLSMEIFHFNFKSAQHQECYLRDYHGQTKGKDCQYIGFLDDSFNVDQFQAFNLPSRHYIFVNVGPNTFTKQTLDCSDISDYNQAIISKESVCTVAKVPCAFSETSQYNMETETTEGYEYVRNSIDGEYVLVCNIPIPVIMITSQITFDPTGSTRIRNTPDLLKYLLRSLNASQSVFPEYTISKMEIQPNTPQGVEELKTRDGFSVINELGRGNSVPP
jgi:hypothetical protein